MALLMGLTPLSALAYVGPGAGLSAIGSFLALIAAVFLALVGFIWYPIKRLLRRNKQSNQGIDSSSIAAGAQGAATPADANQHNPRDP